MTNIVFCQCSYSERKHQTLRCVERLAPNLKRLVIIAPEPMQEWKELAAYPNVEYHQRAWNDNFPEYRNFYVELVADGDWIAYSDPDELYCEKLAEDLQQIVDASDAQGCNHLFINSHDISHDADGQTRTSVSNFHKGLLFKKMPGSRYVGGGVSQNVHESLIIGPERQGKLRPEYYYEHTKFWWEVWERAGRNVFIGGGGNNAGEKNPSWRQLREICHGLGLDTWEQARAYFRKGDCDIKLKQWLVQNSYDGLDYEHEEMEMGRWYFEYLHPEEAEGWKIETALPEGSYAEVMRFVEQEYLRVIGRHAGQEEKEALAREILAGTLHRADVERRIRP